MNGTPEPGYRAYLLRLRRTGGIRPAWRASLEEVPTGERHSFGSLDEMADYLRAEIGEVGQDPPDPAAER